MASPKKKTDKKPKVKNSSTPPVHDEEQLQQKLLEHELNLFKEQAEHLFDDNK